MMVSQTLSYDSPLYGRRTAQIKLKQIPFKYYHSFFKNKNEKDLIEAYSVTGGVPKYIELFTNDSNIYQSIENCILNQSSYLYDEPRFLLQQEVSEVGSYFSIIKVIAAGNQKLSTISSALGIKATSLTKYLKTLIDLDILEREIPITESNPEKSKKGLYKIKDNYIRFWFLFIYPNISFIESGHGDYVLSKIRNEFISKQVSFVYEDICIDRMWELNMKKVWPFHFSKVGRWWNGKDEIDIVALDNEQNNLILGECKYWKEKVGLNILKELERKSESVEWNKNNRQVWYILFSANGFSDELMELSKNRNDLILISEIEQM